MDTQASLTKERQIEVNADPLVPEKGGLCDNVIQSVVHGLVLV